jgi:hypothetical protein
MLGLLIKPFLVFRATKPPIPAPEAKGHPFAVGLLTQHEEIWIRIQTGKSVRYCYDPTLIARANNLPYSEHIDYFCLKGPLPFPPVI